MKLPPASECIKAAHFAEYEPSRRISKAKGRRFAPAKDPLFPLSLLLRCKHTKTSGCPILSASLFLRLGWDTSNPTPRFSSSYPLVMSERGPKRSSVPGSPKSGLCSLGWRLGVVSRRICFCTCPCFCDATHQDQRVPHPKRVFVFALRVGYLEPEPPVLLFLSACHERTGPQTQFSSGVPKERSVLFGVEVGGGESKDLLLPLSLHLRCKHTKTSGCPILSASLFLRLGWDTSNPTPRFSSSYPLVMSERGPKRSSVPGSPKSGLCSLGWRLGVVSRRIRFCTCPCFCDANSPRPAGAPS